MIFTGRRRLLLAVVLMLALAGGALAYGSSTEDLVGVFSIEKTIKLGSSSSCFENPNQMDPDPLGQSAVSPVINPMADNQAPTIAGFGIEPGVLSKDSCAINFTLHAVDDQSGLDSSAAYFKSPSGALTEVLFLPQNRTFGTAKDGIYAARLALPEDAERGVWMVENLTILDIEGNSRIMDREQLLRLGLPTEFLIG